MTVRLASGVIASAPHEIFISYARSSEGQARLIAGLLRDQGFGVWWDDDLPAHRSYSDVIEERLRAAKAVLVLWSAEAAQSQWVRAEADAARQAGTLVQLTLDGAMPPMPFNQIQCPKLNDWGGDPQDPAWSKVRSSIAELTGKPQEREREKPAAPGLSVCVLPFANVSGDPEQEYFSDGITEDLIIALSQISALAVVARNTSFTFKSRSVDIRNVGRQLNVSHVLEGSVRKSGNRLRITAQLIDTSSGHHLWANRFDRSLTDVFEVQDEISEAIVEELKLKLLPGELAPPRHVPDPKAYQAVLKARHCWNRGTEAALHQAVSFYREAIGHDALYARAYAGLADAFVLLGNHTYLDPSEAYSLAKEAAERALALDPDLSDAHASLGLIAFVHDWNGAVAERHLRSAVEIDPASPTARLHLSRLLSALGKHEEAIAHARAAAELDPLSVASAVQVAGAKDLAGDSEAAVKDLLKALDVFPDEFRIYYKLAFALASLGRNDEAIRAAEDAVRVGGRTMFALGVLGYATACAGQSDRARAVLAEMEAAAEERYVCPFDIAAIYAGLGDTEAALDWLEKALAMRDHAMLFAQVDPALAPLRGDDRFSRIAGEVWKGRSGS